jgi:hypothetical protein
MLNLISSFWIFNAGSSQKTRDIHHIHTWVHTQLKMCEPEKNNAMHFYIE